MMYVIKKSSNYTKILVTFIAIYLLFFKVEGFGMSGFDGLLLEAPVKSNVLIKPTRKLAPSFGSAGTPLNDHLATDKKDHMFLFKDNMCSPSCCPSTYSCNGGCVCTTEQEQKLGHVNNSDNPEPSEDIATK